MLNPVGGATPSPEYLDSEESVQEFVHYAMKRDEFAFDTETTGLSPTWAHRAVFFSLAAGQRRACIPAVLYPAAKPLFEDRIKYKVGHNTSYDVHMLDNLGMNVVIQDPLVDTAVMSMRENSARPAHNLKYLAADGLYQPDDPRYCQYPDFKALFLEGKTVKERSKIVLATELLKAENRTKVIHYASMDAWATLLAYRELRSRLEATPATRPGTNLWDLYVALEIPLTRVLCDYETAGVPLDPDYLLGLEPELIRDMENMVQQVSTDTGKILNPSSSPQLAQYLFEEMGLTPMRYTKGGVKAIKVASTDEPSLDLLEASLRNENHPHYAHPQKDLLLRVFKNVLEYRGLHKFLSQYIRGLVPHMDPLGRIHTSLNQGGTTTGRSSSSRPNLQNIPRRKDPYETRRAFRAPPSWKIVCFDFDQVEMKIMAIRSGDQTMLDAIKNGKDIHSVTVALSLGVPYEDVVASKSAKTPTDQQKIYIRERDTKKSVGFGIIFEISASGLARQLRCSEREAQIQLDQWLDQYPGIRKYIHTTHRQISVDGYSSTMAGWRRYFPAAKLEPQDTVENHARDYLFQEAMRAGTNMTIQGTAADLMKVALIRVHKDPMLRSLGWTPLLTVHDECLGLAPEENAKVILERCLELAKNPQEDLGMTYPIDITSSGGIGNSWFEAKA